MRRRRELCEYIAELETQNKDLGYLIFRGIGNRICSKCSGTGKIKKEKK